MATKQAQFKTVADFLAQYEHQVKGADAPTETGLYDGKSAHPTAKAPDMTQTPAEGSHGKELSKEVKKQFPAGVVEKTEDAKAAADLLAHISGTIKKAGETCGACKKSPCSCAVKKAGEGAVTPGTAAEDQVNQGPKQLDSDDPAPTKPKATKDDGQYDGPSSHPARTDNDELNGGKYAEDKPFGYYIAEMRKLADDICAQVISLPSAQAPAVKEGGDPNLDPALAQQVGWELAGLVNTLTDKQAADAVVHTGLEEILWRGIADGEKAADYYDAYFSGRKQAAGDEPPPPASPAEQGGGPPAMGPDAAMAAAGGGAPGGGDPQQMIEQIAQQLGIPPEQLMQLLQEAAQNGGTPGSAEAPAGGPPPGGPPMGGPPAGGPPPEPMPKAASAPKLEEKMANIKDVLVEMMARSRASGGLAQAA